MMKGKMYVYKTNGEIEAHDLTAPPGLEALQAEVGGFIELIPRFNHFGFMPCIAYCNEEGKIHNLPMNAIATMLWHRALGHQPNDVLVGNVVILFGDKEFMRAL